jgi:hypothetical protein
MQKGHQEITEHFVPRSDLVLFVTSVDRAFSESEKTFVERIREFKKKLVVVITKIDTLSSENDAQEITEFVKRNFRDLLSIDPVVFPLSSKLALRAKLETLQGNVNPSPEASQALSVHPLWKLSNFEALEKYILQVLSPEERTKLKFENPLGVAEHIIEKYRLEMQQRNKILSGDVEAIERIEQRLKDYEIETKKDFELQKERVDNILMKMEKRGLGFFDERLTITNIFGLTDTGKLKADFERIVAGDTNLDVERQMSAIIDWVLQKRTKIWKDCAEYVSDRSKITATSEDRPNPSKLLNASFDVDRGALLHGIGHAAMQVTHTFDR